MSPRAAQLRPRSNRPRRLAAALSLLLAAGCAQPGPLTSRYTMIGSLKSSLAQTEAERDAMKREVADLKLQNRRMKDQIVQAESANGELTARLDDARHLIRNQGGDADSVAPDFDREAIPPPRTAPAGRASRPGRKAPLTQIPGVQPIDEGDQGFDDDPPTAPRGRDRSSYYDEPQSRLDDPSPWRPMARGNGRLAAGGLR